MRVLLSLSIALLLAPPSFAQYGDISDVKLIKPEDKDDVKSTPAPRRGNGALRRQEPG